MNSETTVFVVFANSAASWTSKLVSWEVGAPDLRNSEIGTPKLGAPKPGTPKPGTPKTGAPKTGSPKSETPKSGTPKPGTPKPGTPKSGAPKIPRFRKSGTHNQNSWTQKFRNHCFCGVFLLNNQTRELRSWSSRSEEFRNLELRT